MAKHLCPCLQAKPRTFLRSCSSSFGNLCTFLQETLSRTHTSQVFLLIPLNDWGDLSVLKKVSATPRLFDCVCSRTLHLHRIVSRTHDLCSRVSDRLPSLSGKSIFNVTRSRHCAILRGYDPIESVAASQSSWHRSLGCPNIMCSCPEAG